MVIFLFYALVFHFHLLEHLFRIFQDTLRLFLSVLKYMFLQNLCRFYSLKVKIPPPVLFQRTLFFDSISSALSTATRFRHPQLEGYQTFRRTLFLPGQENNSEDSYR